MLGMQNEEKIDLINSQKGVFHRLFGAEGRARCHWRSNLLEDCQMPGFGFDFLCSQGFHTLYVQGDVVHLRSGMPKFRSPLCLLILLSVVLI